jgi:predicted dehydrogenase
MSIKVGMVGVGQFAQHFIPLFKVHPLVHDIVLCDLDAAKLRAASDKFGIPKTYPSLDAVLDSDVDAVAIITQHWMHGPQAVQALRAGKHVYSAVPCGVSLEEVTQLVRAVEQTGRIYMMGETSYYYPHVIWCREQHRRGTFGDIFYAETNYHHDWDIKSIDSRGIIRARTGDRFLELAGEPPMHYPTHTTSQFIGVTGARMTHVSAHGWRDRHPDGIYDPAVNKYRNAFSNETALFTLSDGACACVNEFRRVGHPGGEFMSLCGTEASFEYTQAGRVVIGKGFEDTKRLDDILTLRPDVYGGTAAVQDVGRLPASFANQPNNHWGAHHFLVDDFVKACVTGEQAPNHVWQAARYLLPGLVAHDSAEQGGVQLPIPDLGGPRVS